MSVDYDEPDQTMDRFGMMVGVVVDRDDPDKVGRVRVRVPGFYSPASPWCRPMGLPGGGQKDRGTWWVPDVDSEVVIFLNRGDEDHPYYMPAQWGLGEPPIASDDGNPDVRVIALGTYDLVVDARPGSKKLLIVDKAAPQNSIELDGTDRTLTISSTVGINIRSVGQINIDGLNVVINGVVAGLGQL